MVATVWLMTVTVVDLATESTVRTIDGLAAIIIDGVRKFQQRHLQPHPYLHAKMPYWSRLTVLARSKRSTATKSSAAAAVAGAATAAGAVARFTTLKLLIKAA